MNMRYCNIQTAPDDNPYQLWDKYGDVFNLQEWLNYFNDIAWYWIGNTAYCGFLYTAGIVDKTYGVDWLTRITRNAGNNYGYSC